MSLLAVDLLVLPEHSLHGESLLADGALKRFLSGVRPDVLAQPGRSGETSATGVAAEVQHPLVEVLVQLQPLSGGEPLVAQEAAMRRFPLRFETT